jgi:S1-C subfamily serine protease
MNEIQMLEAVERYIRAEMKPDERVYFEQLRKTNPELDQLVVEHTIFLHQMHELGELKNFKTSLNEIHVDLAEKGLINSERLKGKAKVIYLWKRYKRVAAIAASIAGITTLGISALVWSLSSNAPSDEKINLLERKFIDQERKTNQLSQEISNVKSKVTTPAVSYKTGGTGFIIDVKGYLVTNYHVIQGARNIAIENSKGVDFNAIVVYEDKSKDIAILKIDDSTFKPLTSIPYSISKSSPELAEQIFTLGYPRNEIVYGEGYLSAKTGFQGDTLSCQISVAANSGNSGSPILNKNGEVIGVLNGRQSNADGFAFAIHSKYIFASIEELKKRDTAFARIKIPSVSNIRKIQREQQVEKIENFVYMVKVNR